MNDILKQRLVGALVLIALGVIFWPVIFVESERGSLDRASQLEPMPALKDVAIPAPKPLANVEPVRPAPGPSEEEIAEADQVLKAAAQPQPVEPRQKVAKPEPQAEKSRPPAKAKPTSTEDKTASAPPAKPKPSSKPKAKAKAAVPELPKAETSTPAPASPALDEQGIPIAWVLQVASVSTREKADKLTADLLARDYKAYHRAVRRDDVVLYRVFVGPVFEREKLTAVKRDIDRQLNVSAIIARYVP